MTEPKILYPCDQTHFLIMLLHKLGIESAYKVEFSSRAVIIGGGMSVSCPMI